MTGALWKDLPDHREDLVRGTYTTRVVQAGRGPRLLLLHGQGGSLENFRHNIPAYARHFHVAALDLLWHGRSGTPEVDPELLPTWLAQVAEVVGFLGWDDYAVEGQSLGGWIAALHALARPRQVTSLVLTTPMGLDADSGPPDAAVRRRALAAQLAALDELTTDAVRARMALLFADPGSGLDEEIVQLRREFYGDPAVNKALRAVAHAYLGGEGTDRFRLGPADLGRLTTPALLYWGTGNPGGDLAGRRLADAIPGARYHCAEVGHWAQYERPDEHNRVVLDFLGAGCAPAQG
ncbi:alpha/beta fold hydrolase [Streptomyces sp. YKOK-I1]